MQETKRALEGIGYDVVGDNLGESRVKIKTIKNTKIAFLSYTYGFENQNSKTKEELDSANIYNSEIAKKDLEYAKENADYSIIIMHWGDAYSTKPNKEQQNIAKFLVENGADMILGNHASAVQKMKVMQSPEGKNVLVAYSLGNYISGEIMDISKIELVLNIELRKSGETGEVVLSKVDASVAGVPVQSAAIMPEQSEEQPEELLYGDEIKAPLVGTFYVAPSEGAEPFVSVGDKVKKGQVIGIVEAMKLMNEVESEYEGTVAAILVENGEMVEYGQPLMVIQ